MAERVRKRQQSARPADRSTGDLNRESWLEFLNTETSTQEGEILRINGQRLQPSALRALYRWRHEGASPSVFAADRFLIAVGLHLSDYFLYCQVRGLRPWVRAIPPAWHEQDWWWETQE